MMMMMKRFFSKERVWQVELRLTSVADYDDDDCDDDDDICDHCDDDDDDDDDEKTLFKRAGNGRSSYG